VPRTRADSATAFVRAGRKARGRTIYCKDLRSEQMLAALMFHLDDHATLPVEINDVAMRLADPKYPQA
jgi:hypothetical protein